MNETLPTPRMISTADGRRLAHHTVDGAGSTLVWMGGFRSDMTGGKAVALHDWAARTGRRFVRFDYTGHGQSSGDFAHGTITQWRNDALTIIDQITEGPIIPVGSSMGGWIALLVALARPERVAGLALIAPAADFTQTLMWDLFPDEVKREIETTGQWMRPSEYDDGPYPITKRLIEDGRQHLVLDKPKIPITVPVRILQGMCDDAVPWRHALLTAEKLASDDVTVTLVKNGDHRLSTEPDIARLIATVEALT